MLLTCCSVVIRCLVMVFIGPCWVLFSNCGRCRRSVLGLREGLHRRRRVAHGQSRPMTTTNRTINNSFNSYWMPFKFCERLGNNFSLVMVLFYRPKVKPFHPFRLAQSQWPTKLQTSISPQPQHLQQPFNITHILQFTHYHTILLYSQERVDS